MRLGTFTSTVLIAILVMAESGSAYAGPNTDDMAKCLVSSTSPADRGVFMKWLFRAMASNPEVASMASITDAQRDQIDRTAAALVLKLLTASCRQEVLQAIKYEGPGAIQASFQVFGQVAGRELMANPQVAESMGRMTKFINQPEMSKLVAEASAK